MKMQAAKDTLSRDEQILSALTRKVRLLSLEQIAGAWWDRSKDPLADARHRLAALERRGLIEPHSVLTRQMVTLKGPLFAWNPGDAAPDAESVSYRLQSRWDTAAEPTTVYIATARYCRLVGVEGGAIKHPFQVTHDLHVAAIYLRLADEAPTLAEGWVGEELLASERIGQKLPDALIRDPAGRDRLVIEFGGSYDARRVGEFHADCAARKLPYQLW